VVALVDLDVPHSIESCKATTVSADCLVVFATAMHFLRVMCQVQCNPLHLHWINGLLSVLAHIFVISHWDGRRMIRPSLGRGLGLFGWFYYYNRHQEHKIGVWRVQGWIVSSLLRTGVAPKINSLVWLMEGVPASDGLLEKCQEHCQLRLRVWWIRPPYLTLVYFRKVRFFLGYAVVGAA
jgi:hypothetical protein